MTSPRHLLVLFLATLGPLWFAACGSGDGGENGAPSPNPPAPDASSDLPITTPNPEDATTSPDGRPDGGSVCALGVEVSRQQFVAESINYLRSAFGVTSGFAGGDVSYGEMWVSLGSDCPLADWTSLSYTAAIDPALVPIELRPTHDRVAVVWALNGRRGLVYVSTGAPGNTWQTGQLPDNLTAIRKNGVSDDASNTFIQQLSAAHPKVKVDWLDAIGIVTLSSEVGDLTNDDPTLPKASVPEIEAAVAELRQSNLFESFEWSGLVFRIPSESWPALPQNSELLQPECLRKETRALRDQDALSTVPSLAPPLGQGMVVNTKACQ